MGCGEGRDAPFILNKGLEGNSPQRKIRCSSVKMTRFGAFQCLLNILFTHLTWGDVHLVSRLPTPVVVGR